MTTTTACGAHVAPRSRPTGINRLLTRISPATLLRTRRRSMRPALDREEQIRIHQVRQSVQRREHDVALLVTRLY